MNMTIDEMYRTIIRIGLEHNLCFLREYAVPFFENVNDIERDGTYGKIDLAWFSGNPAIDPNARTPVALFEIEGANGAQGSIDADIDKFRWSPAYRGSPKVLALFSNRAEIVLRFQERIHTSVHQAALGIDILIDHDVAALEQSLRTIFNRAQLAH
jgi:hypothetical protein